MIQSKVKQSLLPREDRTRPHLVQSGVGDIYLVPNYAISEGILMHGESGSIGDIRAINHRHMAYFRGEVVLSNNGEPAFAGEDSVA